MAKSKARIKKTRQYEVKVTPIRVKEYRPKNWVNPYTDKHGPHTNSWERLCFERGADAMLGALKEQGRSPRRRSI